MFPQAAGLLKAMSMVGWIAIAAGVLCILLNVIVRSQMPLFFMITGVALVGISQGLQSSPVGLALWTVGALAVGVVLLVVGPPALGMLDAIRGEK